MAATATDNVELVRGIYDAFNQGDLDTVLASMADDVTWVEPEGDPLFGGTYQTPDDVRTHVFIPALEEYDDFTVTPNRFIDGSDTVVVEGVFTGTSKAGTPFELPFAHVCDVQDGKLTRFTNYEDTALSQQTREA
ncbi:nuclear transport factor 2 family protein [Haladaptatus pallidirubidus]|uniref:Nuclear transport factor 2 family protein n=1 Tax=Haladaptatus pallidirubidus TaxID=1008152 RepID=A0AAV3UK59_9EURY|nr:nuclear transport factor 2 family protein [Haladaptatus pallidirubidus]